MSLGGDRAYTTVDGRSSNAPAFGVRPMTKCRPAQEKGKRYEGRVRPMRIWSAIIGVWATMLVMPVQAIEEPHLDARANAAARSWHIDLAQLEAPIGHRQPTLDDLPPWLRDEEKPGAETQEAPQAGGVDAEQKDQRHGRRAPRAKPDDGVPRICDPC